MGGSATSLALPDVTTEWHLDIVVLSYVIAVSGSFCMIQLMEQWRLQLSGHRKAILLFFAAVALGGCGIWAMHFTGMGAEVFRLTDGTELTVDFEGWTTLLSLIFPIAGVYVGLKVASHDPFFLEVEQARRKSMVTKDLRGLSMKSVVQKGLVARRAKYIALFSRLDYIITGGLIAALGVLGMHYLGMTAQRSQFTMRFNAGIVVASCFIATFAATAAFWIVFRALTFWPNSELLRVSCAFIMGIAVCGTHYTGMLAASVTYSVENKAETTTFLIDGNVAFELASHASTVACFWLLSLSVVSGLRGVALSAPSQMTGAASTHSVASPVNNKSVGSGRKASNAGSNSNHVDCLPYGSPSLNKVVALTPGQLEQDLEHGLGVVPHH